MLCLLRNSGKEFVPSLLNDEDHLWTASAESQLVIIGHYLQYNFTQREVAYLLDLIEQFEKTVALFPKVFPYSITA